MEYDLNINYRNEVKIEHMLYIKNFVFGVVLEMMGKTRRIFLL